MYISIQEIELYKYPGLLFRHVFFILTKDAVVSRVHGNFLPAVEYHILVIITSQYFPYSLFIP